MVVVLWESEYCFRHKFICHEKSIWREEVVKQLQEKDILLISVHFLPPFYIGVFQLIGPLFIGKCLVNNNITDELSPHTNVEVFSVIDSWIDS